MRVDRAELLSKLESISPGLASRESFEQSTCFAFDGEWAATFNDEICCRTASPLRGFVGAVAAKPMLELLSRLSDGTLDVDWKGGELLIKGKGRRAGLRTEAEMLLPVGQVEMPDNASWASLDSEFSDAVSMVSPCASEKTSEFALTCVHVNPEFLEACDSTQLCRYPLQIPLDGPCLVRSESLAKATGLAANKIAVTPSWLHLGNSDGVSFSVRRFLDEYRDLSAYLGRGDAVRVTLPGGLDEIIAKAEVFSKATTDGLLSVELRSGVISIKGSGVLGWFEERKSVDWSSDPFKFQIPSKLLLACSKKANEAYLDKKRIIIETGKFTFVAATNM